MLHEMWNLSHWNIFCLVIRLMNTFYKSAQFELENVINYYNKYMFAVTKPNHNRLVQLHKHKLPHPNELDQCCARRSRRTVIELCAVIATIHLRYAGHPTLENTRLLPTLSSRECSNVISSTTLPQCSVKSIANHLVCLDGKTVAIV